MKKILLMLAIFTGSFAYSQETKIYHKDNISFEYPSHWLVRDIPTYYILISEPPKEELTLMATFDVAIDEEYTDLNKYCKSYEGKMANSEQFENFEVKSKDEIKFNGLDAIQYHCTAIVQYLPIEWKSIVFLKDNKVYKLSTTALIGMFYLNKELTDKIFESFKIE